MPASRQIGPFEILEPLGAGGMGEVFKARDTRLNRFVAIKFLPEGAGAAARERFQREAQAIAALNHPNICTLFEVGEDHGRPFLVLELLEGESLKLRLRRGAPAPDQVLDWALDISAALDAAHRKGVLHRDLKPDNLWVTADGHIKVLDFGLARLHSDDAGEAATLGPDRLLTSPGQTMGTIPYMSPEQARGEPLDSRSDLFSFGTVLYEMASGRPAFAGRSAAEVSAAILKDQPPPLSRLRADLPARFEDAVYRCLEKDPDLRYQSAADLRGELKRLKRESGSASQATAAVPLAARSGRRRWAIPVVVAVLAVGVWFWRGGIHLGKPAASAIPQLQFRQLTYSGHVEDAVISPDGKFLAHVDRGPKGTSLHLLSIASGGASNSDAEIMPPAPGCCQSPSFSPDGSQVYFLENRVLKAIPLLGGAVRTIVPAACSGAGFSPDGTRIAYIGDQNASATDALMLARPDGSQARPLHFADPASGYVSQCWGGPNLPSHSPAWSPDGTRIAVVQAALSQIGHVELVNLADGRAEPLPGDVGFASDAAWLPDASGVIVTALKDRVAQIWRLPVPAGAPAVLTNDLFGYDSASVSSVGELAAVHAVPQYSIWAQARPGGEFRQLPGGGSNQDGGNGLAWTPSGGLVSTRNFAGRWQLWAEAGDGSGGHPIETPASVGAITGPAVAPSGTVAFSGDVSVWRVGPDGTGLAELVHPDAKAGALGTVPVRGGPAQADAFAFVYFDDHNIQTLWSAPVAGGPARQLSPTFVLADGIAASPDGSRVFVVSKGTGKVTHVPMLVRADNGEATPVPGMDYNTMPGPYGFTPDGRAITYIANQGTVDNIWAYPIAGGKPYPLTHFTDLRIAAYAMSKDGRLAVSRGSANSDAVVATGLTSGSKGVSH